MNFNSDAVLHIQDVTLFQEDTSILKNINLSLSKGEFAYLIGRTGSGKSTFLKTLYADLPLRIGDIHIAGFGLRNIKDKEVPLLRRKIGIIFQDFELFYDRTVGENLTFVMKATGWKDSSKIKNRLAEVLMRVGLGAVNNKMPHQLSGGEQQRIAIARALINEPQILLADEPTGNLDPQVAEGIFKLFLEINNSGTAVLLATHNHSFLEKYPNRVFKCYNGKLFDSTVEEFSFINE